MDAREQGDVERAVRRMMSRYKPEDWTPEADKVAIYLRDKLDAERLAHEATRKLARELAAALSYVAKGDEWVTSMYAPMLARAREAGL